MRTTILEHFFYKLQLEDQTRLVDKCCTGFLEDDAGTSCISQCQNCTHGDCRSDNTCSCHSGYHGHDCTQGKYMLM